MSDINLEDLDVEDALVLCVNLLISVLNALSSDEATEAEEENN